MLSTERYPIPGCRGLNIDFNVNSLVISFIIRVNLCLFIGTYIVHFKFFVEFTNNWKFKRSCLAPTNNRTKDIVTEKNNELWYAINCGTFLYENIMEKCDKDHSLFLFNII